MSEKANDINVYRAKYEARFVLSSKADWLLIPSCQNLYILDKANNIAYRMKDDGTGRGEFNEAQYKVFGVDTDAKELLMIEQKYIDENSEKNFVLFHDSGKLACKPYSIYELAKENDSFTFN